MSNDILKEDDGRVYSYPTVRALVQWRDERIAALEAQLREAQQQLHDEALAFNHANDIVAKLETENAQLRAELNRGIDDSRATERRPSEPTESTRTA